MGLGNLKVIEMGWLFYYPHAAEAAALTEIKEIEHDTVESRVFD